MAVIRRRRPTGRPQGILLHPVALSGTGRNGLVKLVFNIRPNRLLLRPPSRTTLVYPTTRIESRCMKKAVRIGLLVFFAVDILLLFTSQAGALVRMYVGGKSYCPAWGTLMAVRSVDANLREQARVRREMKLVRSDGDLQLWSTPHGNYWVSQGGEVALPLMLAEET